MQLSGQGIGSSGQCFKVLVVCCLLGRLVVQSVFVAQESDFEDIRVEVEEVGLPSCLVSLRSHHQRLLFNLWGIFFFVSLP
mgnify:FL=1